jgi:hypothetical protein
LLPLDGQESPQNVERSLSPGDERQRVRLFELRQLVLEFGLVQLVVLEFVQLQQLVEFLVVLEFVQLLELQQLVRVGQLRLAGESASQLGASPHGWSRRTKSVGLILRYVPPRSAVRDVADRGPAHPVAGGD